MITTSKNVLSSKKYFKILITNHFKKRWWLYVWIWALGLLFLVSENRGLFGTFFIYFSLLFPFIFIIQFWLFAHSKENTLYTAERQQYIYPDKIIEKLSNGAETIVKIEHFIKADENKEYYFLYVTKNGFMYILKDSFKNNEEKEWFEKEIYYKIKNKTKTSLKK